MNKAGVALLAMRIAALYLGVLALEQFVNVGMYLSYAQNSYGGPWMSGEAAGMIAATALLGFGAAVLFLLAPAFARRFAAEEDSGPTLIRAEAGELTLRLLGIFLWAEATHYLSGISVRLETARIEEDWTGLIILMMTIAILVAVGVWFFVGGRWLARRMFGGTPASGTHSLAALVQPIAFSAIGVWIMATTLQSVLGAIVGLIRSMRNEGYGTFDLYDGGYWTSRLSWICRFVLGLLLFLGGGVVSRLWWRIRAPGRPGSHAGIEPRDKGI